MFNSRNILLETTSLRGFGFKGGYLLFVVCCLALGVRGWRFVLGVWLLVSDVRGLSFVLSVRC